MAVQSAAEGWAALCARRVERQSIDPRSTSASGLGRVKTRWRGDLIEWIIFSIVHFAAKIVMRDGFRSIWEKQFQSFPSLGVFTQPGSDSVLTATRPLQVCPQQRKRESTGGTAVVRQMPTSCRAVVAPA